MTAKKKYSHQGEQRELMGVKKGKKQNSKEECELAEHTSI